MNGDDPNSATTTTTTTSVENVDLSQFDWSQVEVIDFRKKRFIMEESYNDSETSKIEEVYSGKKKG